MSFKLKKDSNGKILKLSSSDVIIKTISPNNNVIEENGNIIIKSGNSVIEELIKDEYSALITILGASYDPSALSTTEFLDLLKNEFFNNSIGNSNGSIDGVTNSKIVIDFAHHERHEGDSFIKCIDASEVTSLIIAFKVPEQNKQPHLTFRWKTEETASLILYKDVTWTTGTGTDIEIINANDNSINESILQGDATGVFLGNKLVKDPDSLVKGSATEIYCETAWSTNQSATYGQEGQRIEHILKPGSLYAFEITSVLGGVWLYLDWYEHEPLNLIPN